MTTFWRNLFFEKKRKEKQEKEKREKEMETTKKLSFSGTVPVFAGISQTEDGEWFTYDTAVITERLRSAMLRAVRGNNIPISFTLVECDFSNYHERDGVYVVRCLVEVDEHEYNKIEHHYQDLSDFYLPGIAFSAHLDPTEASAELHLDITYDDTNDKKQEQNRQQEQKRQQKPPKKVIK